MRSRLTARLALTAAGLLLAFTALPGAVSAANPIFVVNATFDGIDATPGDGICESLPGNGVCTLRGAVMEANALAGADVIELAATNYTLSIPGRDEFGSTTGDINVLGDLTIHGQGLAQTIVQGSPTSWTAAFDRIFDVRGNGTDLHLDNMTIRRGNALTAQGGAISVAGVSASLHLSDVRLTDNHVDQNSGGGIVSYGLLVVDHSRFDANDPSAITSYGPLTVTDSEFTSNAGYGPSIFASGAGNEVQIRRSLFADNHGQSEGTGIYLGTGAVSDSFHAVIENSTFDGNSTAAAFGAAVYVRAGVTLEVNNATIAGNVGYGYYADPGAVVAMRNSIIAGNTAGQCSNHPDTSDHSVDTDGSCGFNGAGDLTAADVHLAGLAGNGGPTRTRALTINSPAIDAGSNCASVDQRGIARPIDGDSDGNATCDMGAFEAAAGTTPPASPTPTPSVTPSPSVIPSPSATASPSVDPSPSVTPDPTPSATPDPTPAPTPSATPSSDPSSDPTPSSTPSATPDPTPTPTPDPTPTPTPDPTPTPTPKGTPVPPTPTPTPTPTVTPDPSVDPTPPPTGGPSDEPSDDPSTPGDGSSDDTHPGPSSGGVQGETGKPRPTLPSTDTLADGGASAPTSSGWILVIVGLSVAAMALVLPDRRKPSA